jgi:hypothetical protein
MRNGFHFYNFAARRLRVRCEHGAQMRRHVAGVFRISLTQVQLSMPIEDKRRHQN